jgi:glucosylceramidase
VFDNVVLKTELPTSVVASSKDRKITGGRGSMKKSRLSSPAKLRELNVEVWLTRPDQSALFNKQSGYLPVDVVTRNSTAITVTPTKGYQTMDGFGFALTGGSADLINKLPQGKRDDLLQELFSTAGSGIGLTYLRIAIGASDLSRVSYSYDDLLPGETDLDLERFNLAAGDIQVVPLLKAILEVNPNIRIIATPWSAPPWMKTNESYIAGKLKPEYYKIYANYFVAFIKKLEYHGILINAITPQNEPLNTKNNPSMSMSALEQADFIRDHLGPALQDAGLGNVELFCYDHNCDRIDYPLTILADAEARKFIKGVAWHLYAGEIEAMSEVANQHTTIKTYFTEYWVGAGSEFADGLRWHIKNIMIGASRNGAQAILEWNLAADPNHGPHTEKGCDLCLGALTIGSSTIARNLSYYVIAHLSRFVRPGSVRIESNTIDSLPNVAFRTPDGEAVLLVLNTGSDMRLVNIRSNGRTASHILDGGAVGTYVWRL